MDSDPDVPKSEQALEMLLRERRFGPPPVGDLMPWDFLQRWPKDVLHVRVWPLISQLLVDPDPVIRARSVEFVQYWSDGVAETVPRMLEIGERRPELFGGDLVDSETLRDEYARAAATLARKHEGPRFATVLRAMAANGPVGGGAAAVLAQFDADFVVTQTRRWGDKGVGWAMDAARALALYQRDHVLDFLEAAKNLDEADRERLLSLVESAIVRDDVSMAAIARSVDLVAPTRAAPNAADCRKAIGFD